MKYKIKILQNGEIWGDVEYRIVDEDGKNKILSDADGRKWGSKAWIETLEDNTIIEHEAEYSIEIIEYNEEQDYDYLIEKCYKNRREAYGSISDQLDEIYHDMDSWKSRIASIKSMYPKPV